ncbi:MAG TPA: NUDIX domain-containing protein [Mycobacteriales bacterium]
MSVAVDLAVFTVRDDAFAILMIERGQEPFRGRLALPGGFVEADENLDQAAARELHEETGLDAADLHLEQLRAYGDPDRDPRPTRVVSICYLALMPDLPLPTAGGDARAARWMAVDDVLGGPAEIAFDHRRIIGDAVERARGMLEHSTVGTAFCADQFAISDLRRVYEIVWGRRLDPGNFSRKVTGVDGFLVPTGEFSRDGGRPAALYRRGPATTLHPPLLRSTR